MLLANLALPAAAQQAGPADDDRAHFELMPYLVFFDAVAPVTRII
jgi:hypothetical protein